MNEHTSTAGNNLLSRDEWDSARSHTLVACFAAHSVTGQTDTAAHQLAGHIFKEMSAGRPFTTETTERARELTGEARALFTGRTDQFVTEARRALDALLRLLPEGNDNDVE